MLWAQSLYILGSLIQDGLLDPNEIDPLGLHKKSQYKSNTDTVVQIVLLSESDALKAKLLEWGVESQTIDDVAPYCIASPVALRDAFGALGLNKKLGLSGRPKRPIGTLSTCKGYRFNGRTFFFIPHFMDMEEFYMTSDNNYLISLFEHELIFIKNNWNSVGRPTMCLLVKKQMISSANRDKASLLDFFVSLRSGSFKSMRVRLGRLQEMAATSCIESLDFLTEKLSAGEIKRQFMDPLKGSPTSATSSHLNEFMLLGIRKRVKSYRIDAGKNQSPSISAQDSPMDSHIINLPKKSPFKLKEPEDSSKRRTTSPQPIVRGRSDSNASISTLNAALKDPCYISTEQEMKHFTLYDSTNIQEAIEILKESANLYEQLDLLHYLYTCNGLDYDTGISTVQVLLEEVYVKACSISLWSIVRRSASLLKKVVNSLSINLIDLLIQQKQVSIGYGEGEFFINEPIPPEKLREIIYDQSRFNEELSDPSLVQEILTYLGSFVRAEPKLYDGILRIRIHHLIITLRDEIALQKGYSESEAYLHLISLSPSELKNMLKALLQGSLNPVDPPARSVVALNEMQDFETNWFAKVTEVIHISVESAGYSDGNFSLIRIEGNSSFSMRGERGINIVVVESKDGTIKRQVTFDTHSSEDESEDLVKFIQYIGEHDIIIFSICDDASERLSSKARDALKMLGSEQAINLRYRDSWAMITRKTNRTSFVVESYKKAGSGGVKALSKSVNLLVAKDTSIVPAFGPSKSLYLHKRRINGALNRVPSKFYPRVWNILARCKGLYIGPNLLPRDPTVSEKTPEEFNFALQVEHHLEAIQDPAERHMVVECLMILSKIQERNPEIDLRSQTINVNKILKEAVNMFWNYMKKNENFKVSTTIPTNLKSF